MIRVISAQKLLTVVRDMLFAGKPLVKKVIAKAGWLFDVFGPRQVLVPIAVSLPATHQPKQRGQK